MITVTSYEGLFFSWDFTTQQVQQDRDEQNGWHSLKGHLPHKQREDRGREQLHKGSEAKCLRLPGLRLFRLSDLGANTQGFPVWKAVNRKLEETLLKEEALQPEASETDRLQAS